MRRHPIVFVVGTAKIGGDTRVMTCLANDRFSRGQDVTVLSFDEADPRPRFALNPGIRNFPLGAPPQSIDAQSRPVRSIIYAAFQIFLLRRALKHQIWLSGPWVSVVSLCTYYNILMLVASFGLPVQRVVCDHVYPSFDSFFLRMLRPFFYLFADRIVVLTTSMKLAMPRFLQRKTTVIANPAIKLTSNLGAGSALAIRSERPFILGAGRLVPQKRFDLLIDAFARIAGTRPEWDLVIAGEGPLEKNLREQSNRLGVGQRVRFLGLIEDMAALYASASLFVLSSDYEGFPMVLCEAMAAGLPIISTRCPSGPEDIVRDRVDGWLVDVGSVEQLASAICSLIENSEARLRLGREAKSVAERFSEKRFHSEWEAFFNSEPNLR